MNTAPTYRLRLYVAGDSPNSMQARLNLDRLCREHLAQSHRIEVIDVLAEPERALRDKILVTPTLVKLEPRPVRTVLGNLGNASVVLNSLGLNPAPT